MLAPALPPLRSVIPVTLLAILFGTVAFSLGELNGLLLGIVIVGGLVYFWSVRAERDIACALDAGEIEICRNRKIVGLLVGLARNAGVAPPRLYVLRHEEPTAWMIGVNPNRSSIVATSALLSSLTRKELAAVLAHELAHIRSRDSIVVMTVWAILEPIAAAVFVLFYIARAAGLGRSLAGLLLTGSNGFLLLIGCAMMRDREYEADRLAAAICDSPDWLMSALHRIDQVQRHGERRDSPGLLHTLWSAWPRLDYEAFRAPGTGLFGCHPPTSARIARLKRLHPKDG